MITEPPIQRPRNLFAELGETLIEMLGDFKSERPENRARAEAIDSASAAIRLYLLKPSPDTSLIEKMEAKKWGSLPARDNGHYDQMLGYNQGIADAIDILRQHVPETNFANIPEAGTGSQGSEIRLLSECCGREVGTLRYCPKCGYECRVKEAPEPVSVGLNFNDLVRLGWEAYLEAMSATRNSELLFKTGVKAILDAAEVSYVE